MTSNSACAVEDLQHRREDVAAESPPKPAAGAPRGTVGTSAPGTSESPDANVVTSWPRRSSSLTSSKTTRSVPP